MRRVLFKSGMSKRDNAVAVSSIVNTLSPGQELTSLSILGIAVGVCEGPVGEGRHGCIGFQGGCDFQLVGRTEGSQRVMPLSL